MRVVFWRGNAKKLSFWFTLICSPPFLESFAHEFFLNKTSWFCCPQKVVREKFLHFAEVDKTMRFAEATMSEFFLLHKVGFFASYEEMGCNASQWQSFQKWKFHFIEWALRVMLEEGAETHCQYLENLPTTKSTVTLSSQSLDISFSMYSFSFSESEREICTSLRVPFNVFLWLKLRNKML